MRLFCAPSAGRQQEAPVIEREIDLPTPDGVMNTFVTQPEEGGPHPAGAEELG